jgi:hypothetical protein
MSIEDEWSNFLKSNNSNIKTTIPEICLDDKIKAPEMPICDELYISTKTKVLFLNQQIDIHRIFWLIPIAAYNSENECVIKKQIKIVSKTKEEYEEYKKRLETIPYYVENILKQIDNPSARRIKFKDERKITIGLSKKDIMNCRGKVKNAFYNCFALIVRFLYNDSFKEIHIKVFNTGKLEIPGVLNNDILEIVKRIILEIIQPHIERQLEFIESNQEDNVLINSNFNCGFYINRERLHTILRSEKYQIESAYDPCSYPGVKCKFYYNHDIKNDDEQIGQVLMQDRKMKMNELIENNKYREVSFMIFRTGSCLIVGNCNETILMVVYRFIRKILSEEYSNIYVTTECTGIKTKVINVRKKIVQVSTDYYNNIISI